MSPRRLFHCAGFLCLYAMNCSVAFALAYCLASIYKEPYAGLALQGAIFCAYFLAALGVLTLVCVTVLAAARWHAKAAVLSARADQAPLHQELKP